MRPAMKMIGNWVSAVVSSRRKSSPLRPANRTSNTGQAAHPGALCRGIHKRTPSAAGKPSEGATAERLTDRRVVESDNDRL